MQRIRLFLTISIILILTAGFSTVWAQLGDRDGDGVPDSLDRCPDVPGPRTNDGCPVGAPDPTDANPAPAPSGDRDGDGVTDDIDFCLDDPGPLANGGCPLPVDPTATPAPPLPVLAQDGDCLIATAGWDNVAIRSVPSTEAPSIGALTPTDTRVVRGEFEVEGEMWRWLGDGWVAGWVSRLGGNCDFPPPVLTEDDEDVPPDPALTAVTPDDNTVLIDHIVFANLLDGICPPRPVVVVIGNASALHPDIVVAGPSYIGTDCDEEIHGDSANNLIIGGGGDDHIEGGNGDDLLYGGNGDDTINGQFGNDLIVGGPGNDRVFGSYGSDRMYGNAGNDRMNGSLGDDEMWGGSGDDYMEGREGNDVLVGGSGNDQLFGDYETDIVSVSDGPDDDWLDGGSGDDRIDGGKGNDQIYGRAGEDVIYGGLGSEFISGGDDDDTVFADDDNDFVYGNEEDDWIDGGPEFDFVIGGSGIDKCLHSEITNCDAIG